MPIAVGEVVLARQTTEGTDQQGAVAVHHQSEWTGHISYVLGYKGLQREWCPANDQVEFGLIDFDIKRADWPISFAAQLLLTYDSDIPNLPGFRGDQSGTYEFNVGLRKILGRLPRYQPFLGGGLSIIGGSTASLIEFNKFESATVQEDHDVGLGFWADLGFYWSLGTNWHMGLRAQYSWGKITLFGQELNAGGVHGMVMLGYNW